MPAMSRTFSIGSLDIRLHEPSLTADNLGLKTWASSYLLSKRLSTLNPPRDVSNRLRVLELGSGTGLVGLAAAAIWGADVQLTDLEEILPNLNRNVLANNKAIEWAGGTATTAVLDWETPEAIDGPSTQEKKYPVILAADPLYSPEHPSLLVQTIQGWLSTEVSAMVVIELPLREAYKPEIEDLRQRLLDIGLVLKEQGEESGRDDWGAGRNEEPKLVNCWWGVYVRKMT
jgi:predicted nicotinamide N-methyase